MLKNRMTPDEKQLIDVICPALQSKSLIRIWYRNDTTGLQDWRTVEPYLIGSFPRKNIQLSAWFLPSPEQKLAGQKEGWRAYLLKNISEVQIQDTNFKMLRPDFDPTGNGMKDLFCVIKKGVDPIMKIVR